MSHFPECCSNFPSSLHHGTSSCQTKSIKANQNKKFPTLSGNATSGFYNFCDSQITLQFNYGLYFSTCGHTLLLILLHPYSKTSVRNLIVKYLSSLYTLHHVLFLHVTLPYSPIYLMYHSLGCCYLMTGLHCETFHF